jgi:hypothetical protein
MTVVLLLHNLCAFLWLGCVLAEIAMERGNARGPLGRSLLYLVHGRLDLFVELPAFLGLVLTGGSLAGLLPLTPLLTAKVAAGLVAVGANIYGVLLIGRPLEASEVVTWTRWDGARTRGDFAFTAALIVFALGAHVLAVG